MVQFGKHVAASRSTTRHFLVDYDALGRISAPDAFKELWTDSLRKAELAHAEAIATIWQGVWSAISQSGCPAVRRGLSPMDAIRTFAEISTPEATGELLRRINEAEVAATLNAEGMRKAVKKFDKAMIGSKKGAAGGEADGLDLLSYVLLPALYCSNFLQGVELLSAALDTLRDVVGARTAKDLEAMPDRVKTPLRGASSEDRVMAKRGAELEWLHAMIRQIPPPVLECLVAHRGFHSTKDRSVRPLENSLAAYEAAWSSGVQLCECDIAQTADEHVVLVHDVNLARLSLSPDKPSSTTPVSQLTLRELIATRDQLGSRPPLLSDVLRSAVQIGGGARLIIEIKPGNLGATGSLYRVFETEPRLLPACAVIMSFDLYAMHRVATLANFPTVPRTSSGLFPRAASSSFLQGQSSPPLAPTSPPGSVPSSIPGSPVDPYSLGGEKSTQQLLAVSVGDEPPSPSTNGPALPQQRRRSRASFDELMTQNLAHAAGTGTGGLSLASGHRQRPLLLLLTVAEDKDCHCRFNIDTDEWEKDCRVFDGWLKRTGSSSSVSSVATSLDGAYMQFEAAMLEPLGQQRLRQLSSKYTIGVWAFADKDPDSLETMQRLMDCGVSFINSDLPKDFVSGSKTVSPKSVEAPAVD